MVKKEFSVNLDLDDDVDVIKNALVMLMDNRHSRVYANSKGRVKILSELLDMLERLEKKKGKDAIQYVEKVNTFISKNKKRIRKLLLCSKCKYIENVNNDGSECLICSGTSNYITFKTDEYVVYKINAEKSKSIDFMEDVVTGKEKHTIKCKVLYRVYNKVNNKIYELLVDVANNTNQIMVVVEEKGYGGVTSQELMSVYKVITDM